MRSALILFICLATGMVCRAQYVYTIKADSVLITNCDSAELIIQNHTQAVPGFLFNTGNGRTVFKRALVKLTDSTYLIGADTLKVASPSPTVWSLTGNASTNSSSNFIGTTDNLPLVFRVNNYFSGTIDPITDNTAFGSGALYIAYPGSVGIGNTAIGANALTRTTGDYNVALGLNASSSNTSGQYNIALGTNALEDNSTGSANISAGYESLSGLTSGSGNVAIGHFTGEGISTGADNIAIGYGLSFPKDTSNQLLIGAGSSNWIYGINGLIGINTVTPAYTLDVNGQANANILSLSTYETYNAGDSALYWNPTTHTVEMGSPGNGVSHNFNGIGIGTPTISAGSGSGTGATVTIEGTNEGGLITLTTGTSLVASGTILTVNYSTSFPNNSYPITRAGNAATAAMETSNQATYPSGSTTGFSIIGSTTALTASTTYKWYYSVTGR